MCGHMATCWNGHCRLMRQSTIFTMWLDIFSMSFIAQCRYMAQHVNWEWTSQINHIKRCFFEGVFIKIFTEGCLFVPGIWALLIHIIHIKHNQIMLGQGQWSRSTRISFLEESTNNFFEFLRVLFITCLLYIFANPPYTIINECMYMVCFDNDIIDHIPFDVLKLLQKVFFKVQIVTLFSLCIWEF